MTRFPLAISPGELVEAARWLMNEHRIRHLPVVADGKLVGIVSRLDLLRAVPSLAGGERSGEASWEIRQTPVQEIMSQKVMFVRPDTPLADVARILLDQQIDALPVIDEDDHLVGIVTTADLLKLVAGRESRPAGAGSSGGGRSPVQAPC